MNELQIFSKDGFGEVRTLIYNDNPYFIGNDVSNALEYARPYEAVTTHCKGAVSYRIPTNGGRLDFPICANAHGGGLSPP